MDDENAAAISVTMLDQPSVHFFMPKFDIKEEETCENMDIIELDCDSRDASTECDALPPPATEGDNTELIIASPVHFDPMNLLEMADKPAYIYSDEESATEDDETRKSAKQNNILPPELWEEWMSQYQWLLHEESDGNNPFCFYCNKAIFVNSRNQLEKHSVAHLHKQYEKNYLAFKEQKTPTEDSVKEDPDGVTRIGMLKLQRKNEESQLQEYIWKELGLKHPWLERYSILPNAWSAYCNVCCAIINVERPFLRKRHEETVKHREAAQRKLKGVTTTNTDVAVEQQTNPDDNDDTTDETTSTSEQTESFSRRSNDPNYEWFEDLSKDKGRCNLCQIEMIPISFRRHIKTKCHIKNMQKYNRTQAQRDKKDVTNGAKKEVNSQKEKSESESEHDDDEDKETEDTASEKDSEEQGNKRILKNSDAWIKMYPWCKRVANNPGLIFCIYCKIKLSIASPRSKHETSSRHIECEKEYLLQHSSKENLNKGNTEDKRFRFYPWLVRIKNNSEFVLCKYCRTRLNKGHSRPQHERTRRHVEAKAAYLAKRKTFSNGPVNGKKQPRPVFRSLAIKKERPTTNRRSAVKIEQPAKPPPQQLPANTPAIPRPKSIKKSMSLQSRITAWKDRCPWLSFKRVETNPDYGFCKVCEKRVYVPYLKIALKHTRSHGHIRARIQFKRKLTEPESSSKNDKSEKIEKNEKTENYDEWAVNKKEYPTGYVYCKFCEMKVNFMGVNKTSHHNSVAHRKNKERKEKEKNNSQSDSEADNNNAVGSHSAAPHGSTDENRRSWIETLLKRALNIPTDEPADSGDDAPAPKRAKTNQDNSSDTLRELLRLSNSTSNSKQTNEELLPNLLSSSFSIAKCLVPYMQPERPPPPAATPPPPPAAAPERSTFDLFFESVKESLKKLPPDLIGEGKVMIMKVVCDLELRADQRMQQPSTSAMSRVSSPLSGPETPSTTTHGYDLEPYNVSTNRLSVTPRTSSTYTSVEQHCSTPNPIYNTTASATTRTIADTTLTSTRVKPTPQVIARGLAYKAAMASNNKTYDTQQAVGLSGDGVGIRRIQLNSRTQTKVIQLDSSPQQFKTSPQKVAKTVFPTPPRMTPR